MQDNRNDSKLDRSSLEKNFNSSSMSSVNVRQISEDKINTNNEIFLSYIFKGHDVIVPFERRVRVGSDSSVSDITLNSDDISAKHCTFKLQSGVASVIDHASAKGTYVDGKKIQPGKMILLNINDEVLVGSILFRIHIKPSFESTQLNQIEDFTKTNTKTGTVVSKFMDSFRGLINKEEDQEADENTQHDISTSSSFFSLSKVLGSRKKKQFKEGAKLDNSSKKNDKNYPKKIKKIKTIKIPIKQNFNLAGPIRRLYGIIGDLALARFLFIVLSKTPIFTEYFSQMNLIVSNTIKDKFINVSEFGPAKKYLIQIFSNTWNEEVLKIINLIIPMLICFVILRIVGAFLLGLSPSNFLLGMSPKGSFIASRIGGVFREILGVFTFPLIIFDLPILFGIRSLKEVLTNTAVKSGSTPRLIFGGIFILPLVIVGSIASFYMSDIGFLQSYELQENRVSPQDLDIPRVSMSSNNFSALLKYADSKDTLLIPTLRVSKLYSEKKRSNFTSVRPELVFYIPSEKIKGEISLVVKVETEKLNLLKLLRRVRDNSADFSENFPHLNNLVSGAFKNYKMSPLNDGEKISYKMPQEIKTEILKFFKESFALGAKNALQYFSKYKMLVPEFIKFRKNFFLDVHKLQDLKMNIVKLGNGNFLQIRNNEGEEYVSRLYPLDTINTKIIEIKIQKRTNSRKVMDKIIRDFFAEAIWSHDYKDPYKVPMMDENFHMMHILDYLHRDKLNTQTQRKLRVKTFEMYKELYKKGISRDDQLVIDFIHDELTKTLSALNLTTKSNDRDGEEMIRILKDLKFRAEKLDKQYFGL